MMKHKLKKRLLATVCLCCLSSSMTMAMDKSTYETSNGNGIAAKVVYEYKPDSLFAVHTHVGYVSDITLRAGEKVTYIAGGDTKRWLIDQASVGNVTHIYIKPLKSGINTNMIINTDQRSYRLYVVSDDGDYTPILEWEFPEDNTFQKMVDHPLPYKDKAEKQFLDLYTVKKGNTYVLKDINRNYKIRKHGKLSPDVLPTEIFDDGTRTYIHMPPTNKYDQPTLYRVNERNKEELVNYRYRDGYFIADRVFTKARLRYTSSLYIDILPAKTNELHKPEGSDKS